MDIKILVAAHKKYWFPDDDIYMPLHVGKKGKPDLGFPGDDTGDNISEKNINYSELSGLYWAWKNLKCDYLGLCHYRRYFGRKSFFGSIEKRKTQILKRKDYEELLKSADVILPKFRNYYIETVRSQYTHAHSERDLIETRKIIGKFHPEFLPAFDEVMERRKVHLWNMFVMPKNLADEYFEWLFDILFRYEKLMDENGLQGEKYRLYGYISERLLDVWILTKNLKTVETDVVMLEKVNWIKKGGSFLKRKFFGK